MVLAFVLLKVQYILCVILHALYVFSSWQGMLGDDSLNALSNNWEYIDNVKLKCDICMSYLLHNNFLCVFLILFTYVFANKYLCVVRARWLDWQPNQNTKNLQLQCPLDRHTQQITKNRNLTLEPLPYKRGRWDPCLQLWTLNKSNFHHGAQHLKDASWFSVEYLSLELLIMTFHSRLKAR